MNVCIDCRNELQQSADNSGDFFRFFCVRLSPFLPGCGEAAKDGCAARAGNGHSFLDSIV